MSISVPLSALEAAVVQDAVINRDQYHQRGGQALMNAIGTNAPDLYETLIGTQFDCFYDDSKIPKTMAELGFTSRTF